MQIPINEIEITPTSGLDDAGKVFKWKKHIYRGVHASYSEFYKEIFSSQLSEDLVNLGLIPTQVAPYHLDGFEIILEHKTVPFISYPIEWCSAMLKDAALLTCDIQLCLLKSGYSLKDAHPWNVLFDGCEQKFIDIGSISEKSNDRIRFFLKDFRSTFLNPLLLKQGNFSRLVNAMMAHDMGIENQLNLYRMLFNRIPFNHLFYHKKQERKINKIWRKFPNLSIKLLRNQVISIPTHDQPVSSEPTNNQSKKINQFHIKSISNVFESLLEELKPKTVLDIYADTNFFCETAARKGARVIAAHTDESVITKLYVHAKKEKLNILPLLLDICNPTLSHGPWGMCENAQVRLKSDLVIMYNYIDYLIEKKNRTFEDIADYIFQFTKKWALIEFNTKITYCKNSNDKFEDPNHGLNEFLNELSKKFQVNTINDVVQHERHLIVCKKG